VLFFHRWTDSPIRLIHTDHKKPFNSPMTSAFGSSSERFKVSKNDPKLYSPPPGWYDVNPHELVDVEGITRAKQFLAKKA
jgi:hypothetical protein